MSDRVYCDHCERHLTDGARHIRIGVREAVVGLPYNPANQPPVQTLDFCSWEHMAAWADGQMAATSPDPTPIEF